LLDIVVMAFFLAFMAVNAFLALTSGDSRLRSVAILFWAIWVVTHYFPYTEIIVSPISFVILSRLQIRKRGEVQLARWMVPIIAAEAGLFLSHIAYFAVDYITYWILVQAFFIIQLTASTAAGVRKSLVKWRDHEGAASHHTAAKFAPKQTVRRACGVLLMSSIRMPHKIFSEADS
jgi:hypothetical protein